MFEFQYYIPTKIMFGVGNLKNLGNEVSKIGKNVLVITGKESSKKEGILDRILEIFQKENIKVDIFDDAVTNPPLNVVEAGTEIAKKSKPKVIITVGGGSSHDIGKAISLLLTHGSNLSDYTLFGKKGISGIKNNIIPIISIPTVFGTGAEISPAALVRINNKKEIIVSPYLFPKISIIDPSLSISVPPNLTAQIGIDAFVQAMEAFVSKNAQPFSDTFAISAMKHSIEYLPKSIENPNDIKARGFVAISAFESVFAIAQAGVGAIHALSNPLSGHFNIHHGLALSILTTEVMKINLESNIERFAKISELFGEDTEHKSHKELAKKSVNCIESFFNDIGLLPTPKLRKFGVTLNNIDFLTQDSRNSDMFTNPNELSNEDISNIFRKLL